MLYYPSLDVSMRRYVGHFGTAMSADQIKDGPFLCKRAQDKNSAQLFVSWTVRVKYLQIFISERRDSMEYVCVSSVVYKWHWNFKSGLSTLKGDE